MLVQYVAATSCSGILRLLTLAVIHTGFMCGDVGGKELRVLCIYAEVRLLRAMAGRAGALSRDSIAPTARVHTTRR